MTVRTAIQCFDLRTAQTGTFGYHRTGVTCTGHKGFMSVTPVFSDLVGLIEYCEKHDIDRIPCGEGESC
jgi:hypothetical protein